jgi:gliding motility-associated-like protein
LINHKIKQNKKDKFKTHLVSIIILLTLFYCTHVKAQDLSETYGRFSVVNAIGCAPLTVDITELKNLTDENVYYYDAINDPNAIPNKDLSFTYSQAGTYKIVQLTSANNGNESTLDTLTVTVHELIKPDFRIHNCDNHRVRVEILDSNYEFYRVNFTTTVFEDVAPGNFSSEYDYLVAGNYSISVDGMYLNAKDNCGSDNTSINTIQTIVPPIITSANVLVVDQVTGRNDITQTIGENIIYDLEVSINNAQNFEFFREINSNRILFNNLNTLNNFYCYNIKTFDACNNSTFRSDTICTAKIGVISGDGANTLTWETDTTVVDSYNILRDNAVIAQIADTRTSTFDDLNVLCKVSYKYQVQPVFTTGTSLSIDSSVIAFKTANLPPVEFPFSTINNSHVELTWPDIDPAIPLTKYIIEKSTNDRGFKSLSSTDTTYYQDPDTTFFFSRKYRIKYDDECDNRSEASIETVPMLINQDAIRGNEITYSWNKYETWQNGIRNYFLERVDDTGNPFESIPILSGRNFPLVYSPNDIRAKKVRVRAESLDPVPKITYSNIIESELGLNIYFPTAFTPNGDGLNDEYTPNGPLVFNYSMEIYSRWGDLIFISNDIQKGWNGIFNEKHAKTGAYIYKVRYEDVVGTAYNASGSFVLLRD